MASKPVLADHKKSGKRLIPPIMQLEKIVQTSFRDDTLPDLLWIAAIFLRRSDRRAVDQVLQFTKTCSQSIGREDTPPLAFSGNFDKLDTQEKISVRSALIKVGLLEKMHVDLWHHHLLFPNHPLGFLFGDLAPLGDRLTAVVRIKEDVDSLLDRHSYHATKVQTTVIVSMLEDKKMFFGPGIKIPDFNAIFTAPDSDEARRVASFARANLNAGMGMRLTNHVKTTWSRNFWNHAFTLEDCV